VLAGLVKQVQEALEQQVVILCSVALRQLVAVVEVQEILLAGLEVQEVGLVVDRVLELHWQEGQERLHQYKVITVVLEYTLH
jgi:hypothetical protein